MKSPLLNANYPVLRCVTIALERDFCFRTYQNRSRSAGKNPPKEIYVYRIASDPNHLGRYAIAWVLIQHQHQVRYDIHFFAMNPEILEFESFEESIATRVLRVIADVLHIQEAKVRPDCSIQEDLGASSLELVTLSLALEDEFGGTIPEEQLGQLHTVRDIVIYIQERLQIRGPNGT